MATLPKEGMFEELHSIDCRETLNASIVCTAGKSKFDPTSAALHRMPISSSDPATDARPPKHTVGSLMWLMTACCSIAAIAKLFPQALAILVPPILGPIVSWWVLPTFRSLILGVVSAIFWSFVVVMFLGGPLIFSFDDPRPVSGYKTAFVASIGSIVGGYLGSRVERSRLEQIERKRIRDAKHRVEK